MLHYIEWAVIATKSTQFKVGDVPVPFGNILAVCDGPLDKSTGVPYFYVSELDVSIKDTKESDVISIALSEMETSYGKDHHYNAEFPLCGRLTLCGNFKRVTGEEEKFAKAALFSRFPDMKSWDDRTEHHSFFVAKLDVKLVWILDSFGGAKTVDIQKYFSANPLE